MSRSNKRRFAVTLLGVLAFGANAQAKDLNNKITKTDGFSIKSTKPAQNSGKSGRVTIEETKSIDWKTVVGGTIGVLFTAETVHSIVGAATDSKLGSYSVGRAIKNYINKNKQRGPGEKLPFDDKTKKKIDKAVLECDKDKDNAKYEKADEEQEYNPKEANKGADDDENLKIVLGKFEEASKGSPETFERSKTAIMNTYKAFLNNEYHMTDFIISGGKCELVGAVVNFIANEERIPSSAKVVELTVSAGLGFRLKVCRGDVQKYVFLISANHKFMNIIFDDKWAISFNK